MNSKINDCQIKNILYPDLNKPQKKALIKNIQRIKKLEELNRIKKYIQSNQIRRNINFIFIILNWIFIAIPYKTRRFRNISSRVYEIKEEYTNHNKSQKNLDENIFLNKNYKGRNKNKKLARPLSAMNIRDVNSDISKTKENSIFEEINKNEDNKNILLKQNKIDLDMLFEKQLQKLREINKEYELKDIENKELVKYNTNSDMKNILIDNQKNNNEFGISHKTNEMCDKEYNLNNLKKNNIRPISYISNKNHLPRISSPKLNKNIYPKQEEILINKNVDNKSNNLIKNNDHLKIRPISSKINSPLHKDFGKVPKYIQEMKIKAEILKDIEKKKKEEEKYPKGTKLLSEEERLFTLQKLKESKKELENLIEKLPITLNSLSSKNRQKQLYKELDDIEQAIITFSKKQVFVKIDS